MPVKMFMLNLLAARRAEKITLPTWAVAWREGERDSRPRVLRFNRHCKDRILCDLKVR